MTTIATDGKSMAADSLITAGPERVGYTTKVHRSKDGRIFGCAGPSTDCVQFGQWINGDLSEKPKLGDDFSALVLNADGKVLYHNNQLIPIEYLSPMTIGSGEGVAMGAMLMGASPEKAVELAITRDTKSGGAITVEALGA